MSAKSWKQTTQADKIAMKQFVVSNPSDTPLSPEYAASYLGVSPATLQKMRSEDTNGIPFMKIGRQVVYYKRDLEEYIHSLHYYSNTAEYA